MDLATGTPMLSASLVGGVATVWLDRPERRNALHPELLDALARVVAELGADDRVGCLVLTGRGTAFSAGGDVTLDPSRGDGPESQEQTAQRLVRQGGVVDVIHRCPKVTLAALPGPAVGAGLAVALAADLRIAARSARLVLGWRRLGLSSDFGGSWFLTRLVGPARALELFLTDADLDAAAAAELGLVHRVVDDDAVHRAAATWAEEIAGGPPVAHELFKACVRDSLTMDLPALLVVEGGRAAASARAPAHRAAVARWAEERRQRRRA